MNSDPGRKLPLTLSTRDYLLGLECKLAHILTVHAVSPAVEDHLLDITDEIRRAVWRMQQRDLKLLKEGKHPCQKRATLNSTSTTSTTSYKTPAYRASSAIG